MASSHYGRPLQRKLQEAGLQGCVDAGGFKRLLQYAEDVHGSLDRVHEILQLLKSSEPAGRGGAGSSAGARACAGRARRQARAAGSCAAAPAAAARSSGCGRAVSLHAQRRVRALTRARAHTRRADLVAGDDDDGIISAAEVEAAIRQLAGVVTKRDLAFVVSAFDVPRIVYDPVSKRLHADSRPSKLLPTAEVRAARRPRHLVWRGGSSCSAALQPPATLPSTSARSHPPTRSRPQDKHKLYLNRFNLLLQRLRRNRRFQPPNPLQAAAGAAPQAQLTELMGLKGSAGETCIVMGIIGSQVGGEARRGAWGGGLAVG
jgi:hypothetical protein